MRTMLATMVLLGALAAPHAGATQKLRTFEAVGVPHRIETQLPPAGRIGNRDLLSWRIRDRHGRDFGVASLDCNWNRRGRQCVGVFRLARGSMAVSGAGQTRVFGEFVIVGGTGDYAGAHGSLNYNATSSRRLTITGAF